MIVEVTDWNLLQRYYEVEGKDFLGRYLMRWSGQEAVAFPRSLGALFLEESGCPLGGSLQELGGNRGGLGRQDLH